MTILADLEARARDDAAWWAVVDAYLDGLRAYPGPFTSRMLDVGPHDVEHP